jgi:hypothetical protein
MVWARIAVHPSCSQREGMSGRHRQPRVYLSSNGTQLYLPDCSACICFIERVYKKRLEDNRKGRVGRKNGSCVWYLLAGVIIAKLRGA